MNTSPKKNKRNNRQPMSPRRKSLQKSQSLPKLDRSTSSPQTRRGSLGQNKVSKQQREYRVRLIQYIHKLLIEENEELAEEFMDELTYDSLHFLANFSNSSGTYTNLQDLARSKLNKRHKNLITNLVAIIVTVYGEQEEAPITFQPLKQMLNMSVDKMLFTKVTFDEVVNVPFMKEREKRVFTNLRKDQKFQMDWNNYKKEILERK